MALPINSLYSLTWGDYGTSLVSAIQLLRCHGDLVDCTLAAGGRSFPAHKIVLCAASPFLFDLLKNTPCKHPVVMLAGVNPNDLEALLEFVYRGEVSVDHSQLPSLLQAAQLLNIQGLAPQTVAKDDFTQIHLHQMVPQHQVKTVIEDQEQLIATIAAPQQTVHAQVVEDINPVQTINNQNQQIHQVQTHHIQDNVKDIINQLLPTRKRKPRAKKVLAVNSETPIIATKIQRTEGMETVMTTNTETNETQVVHTHPQSQTVHVQHLQPQHQIQIHQPQHQQQQQPQQQLQQQTQHQSQPQQQITTVSVPSGAISNIKTEAQNETIVTVTDATMNPTQTNAVAVSNKVKADSGGKNVKKEPRSRSQSEQPATCPICYAVIRQSRNLRRHLELRHFAKPGVKKERKTPMKKATTSSPASKTAVTVSAPTTTSNSQVPQITSVQTVHSLQTVQVKKDPDQITSSSNPTPVTVTVSGSGQTQTQNTVQSQQQQIQNQHVQQQSTAIIDQTGQITSANGQQQIVAQTENNDGSTSLSIAQVQTLQGHQLQLSNLNQQKNHNILVKKVFILKGNNNTQ